MHKSVLKSIHESTSSSVRVSIRQTIVMRRESKGALYHTVVDDFGKMISLKRREYRQE